MKEMNPSDYKVIFTNRAYNAIIVEGERMSPKETGGILMGHFLDSGHWVVMEVLLPGPESQFQEYSFEYDEKYINYTAKGISSQYELCLQILGLWHRHPGGMDVFSGMDGKANSNFAARFPYGAISALVNFDPEFRLTMYHVLQQPVTEIPSDVTKRTSLLNNIFGKSDLLQHQLIPTPQYTKIDFFVGDDLIPPALFSLRYYPSKNG
jgi:proteasome lid subunit RPN8/RPN11